MLVLEDVTKAYDLQPVIEEICLALEPGVRHLLTAPNGSGKTTLLRVMAGLSRPSRGRVLWDGRPLGPAGRRHLGVVLQQPMLYGDLTGAENLVLFGGLYGLRDTRRRAKRWLERVGLGDVGARPVREYSKGMRQRLAVARAMLHEPDVLLLDEPLDGLDAKGRRVVLGLLEDAAARGAAVFAVMHDTPDGWRPDRRFTLRWGRLVVDG
ncbi:ABC transporter ATP-binding protein [Alicyclobacillus sp.]|uniref:ABC transporter ATP-binding protein n=1 Tax=Alicyclobacillus sp. TaxID=61169 RepID=UPI0025C153EB|nr:ABC transporter ATP-binding protein [Alicyclobacillus sp.]MCL6515807.1 ABC transporter ATP-binding protein [Alicyclobacillus sp.]